MHDTRTGSNRQSAEPRTGRIRRSLAAFSLSAAAVTGGAVLNPAPVAAQAPGTHYTNHCWFVADGSNSTAADWMSDYDLVTDVETTATVGTGTETMEAIVFHYPTAQLFAVDGGQFGVINLTAGASHGDFTPIGSGGLGDVDGLAFDSTTGNMWGTKRNGGSVADVLFRINFTTGAQIGPDITVTPTIYSGPLNGNGSTTLYDIDDLAIDPVTGNFYAIANGAGTLDMLVIIDPASGATSPIGSPADSGIQDIEGLGFTPAGDLIGTAGTGGGSSANSMVDVNKADGTASTRNDGLTYVDHEAVDCLTNGFINPGVSLEKSTNGENADNAPGPYITPGGDVTWTYTVANTGNIALFDLTLGDDIEGSISCSHPDPLLPGQTTTCTHTDTSAQAGQYTNLGTITGTPIDLVGVGYSIDPTSGQWLDPSGAPADFASFDPSANFPLTNVTDTDPSHYFGAEPQIDIELATNGQDADAPTGPSVPAGSTVTWTYAVTNPGNVPVDNVVVVDDNGTPANTADDFNPTYVSGDTNNDGLLDPTETWTYTATDTATSGQYNNDATVDGTGPVTVNPDGSTGPGTPVEDMDPTHHIGETAATADLTIEKDTNGEDADAGTGPHIAVGDPVTWTYVLSNSGDAAVTGVTIIDDTEGNVTNCDWATAGVVPAASTVTCTLTGTATAGQYTNNVSATGTGPSGPLSDTDPSNYFGAEPQIDIELATNGQDADTPTGPLVAEDGTVTWTYVVTNPGNVPVDNVVVVDDNGTPANTGDDFTPTYVSGDTNGDGLLDPTETWTYTAIGTATTGQYRNDATVDGTGPTGIPVSDVDPTHHIGGLAGIDIEKSTNTDDADAAPGPVLPAGADVTWTYTVTNTGDAPLTNVVVTDDIEGSVCTIPVLAAGAIDTCTLTGTAPVGQYVNVASVTAEGPNGQVGDTDASHHFGANASIDIETATNGEDADDTDGPTVPVGSTVTWTYEVTNTGNVDLTDVVVTDDLGGIVCTLPSLAVGETASCTLEGTAGSGVFENIGSVVGTPVDTDGNPILDRATGQTIPDVTDVDPTHHNGRDASIDIEKDTNGIQADDDGDAVALNNGDSVTWTYVVTNTGDADLIDVVVTDDQEGTVCTIASLAAGASETCNLTGTAVTGSYRNVGTATAQPVDDNGAPLGVPVTDSDRSGYNADLADLAIVKTIDGELVAGSSGTYVLGIDNLGPNMATDVIVVDVLPAGLTYRSVTASGWACSASGQTVTCTRPSIAVGENVPDIRILVDVALNLGGSSVMNQATVDSNESDPVEDNNLSTVSIIGSNPVTQGTTTTQATSTSTTVRVKSSLPVTGSDAGKMALVASLMIGLGTLLVIPTRRRNTASD